MRTPTRSSATSIPCCASSASIPDAGRILEVWNKIDRFDPEQRENLENIAARRPPERPCFLVSAETGEGVDALLAAIEDRLAATRMTLDLSIDASDGAGISWLHRNSEVLNKELARRPVRHDRAGRRDQARHRGQPLRCGAARGCPPGERGPIRRSCCLKCRTLRIMTDRPALAGTTLYSLPFASFHSASISCERGVLQRASPRRQRALDIGKTAFEFGVGAAQRQIGIGADMARQIDQREQEIAGFLREFLRVAAIERGLDLVGLLANLAQDFAGIVPVEADAGGLALQFHRARQRRQPGLDAGQQRCVRVLLGRPPRRALGALLGLDAVPGAGDADRRQSAVLVGEDVRMPPDHLAR